MFVPIRSGSGPVFHCFVPIATPALPRESLQVTSVIPPGSCAVPRIVAVASYVALKADAGENRVIEGAAVSLPGPGSDGGFGFSGGGWVGDRLAVRPVSRVPPQYVRRTSSVSTRCRRRSAQRGGRSRDTSPCPACPSAPTRAHGRARAAPPSRHPSPSRSASYRCRQSAGRPRSVQGSQAPDNTCGPECLPRHRTGTHHRAREPRKETDSVRAAPGNPGTKPISTCRDHSASARPISRCTSARGSRLASGP